MGFLFWDRLAVRRSIQDGLYFNFASFQIMNEIRSDSWGRRRGTWSKTLSLMELVHNIRLRWLIWLLVLNNNNRNGFSINFYEM